MSFKTWLQSKLSPYPPEWLNNPDRLAAWAHAHSWSSGNVWAVTPGYGDGWRLFAPGGLAAGEVWPVSNPVAWHAQDATEDAWRLADVEPWMRGWISGHAGEVLEMVEGLRWFDQAAADYEFVIYARVAA